MTQKIQKPWKLQELHAHTAPVRCATLGGRSGQVMATGGDDKKINVWRVGRPNALMSLGGNASSVDCVCFDSAEETLLAGFQGGGMKVYNLEAQKSRVIEGHRTRVLCCDFHPYGDFIASGSQDTNLKIWDLRRKSCIQTYKGHKNIMSTLTKRLSNVRAARSYWTSGSCKGLLLHIEKVNDLAVTCDCIKGIIRSRDDPFTLEECSLLLPILREVVKSDQQEFIIVGLQATQRMIRHFGDIIRRTREYARIHQSAPVDISREERLERCNRCYETVFEIGDILDEKLRNRSSKTCVFSSARDEIRRFCDDCE
eukprot:GHVL01003957.1.p1 GENE.GHVL01003957.1~~GHVL01003957.1.p1  ORF type:complete len:312 (+),score=51.95 GHVL01003957.1:60-995(+)